jgi:hypothetical protein
MFFIGAARAGPASAFALGSFAATRSRQCALVFSQKIIAVILPAFAAANKKPEIVSGQLLCRTVAWHALVGMLRYARYVRRTTSSIKLFPFFPKIGKYS